MGLDIKRDVISGSKIYVNSPINLMIRFFRRRHTTVRDVIDEIRSKK